MVICDIPEKIIADLKKLNDIQSFYLAYEDGSISVRRYFQMDTSKRPVQEVELEFEMGCLVKMLVSNYIIFLCNSEHYEISLDGTLGIYLPDEIIDKSSRSISDIQIVQLLAHTSGLDDIFEQLRTTKGLKPYEFFQSLRRLLFPPGKLYSYCHIGYVVLAYLIEIQTKMSWLDAINEYYGIDLKICSSLEYVDSVSDDMSAESVNSTNSVQEIIPPHLFLAASGRNLHLGIASIDRVVRHFANQALQAYASISAFQPQTQMASLNLQNAIEDKMFFRFGWYAASQYIYYQTAASNEFGSTTVVDLKKGAAICFFSVGKASLATSTIVRHLTKSNVPLAANATTGGNIGIYPKLCRGTYIGNGYTIEIECGLDNDLSLIYRRFHTQRFSRLRFLRQLTSTRYRIDAHSVEDLPIFRAAIVDFLSIDGETVTHLRYGGKVFKKVRRPPVIE